MNGNGTTPAFARPDSTNARGEREWASDGLTKREYTAISLGAWMAAAGFESKLVAKYAVECADALLAELEKEAKP